MKPLITKLESNVLYILELSRLKTQITYNAPIRREPQISDFRVFIYIIFAKRGIWFMYLRF
jgi:hypothetical protein